LSGEKPAIPRVLLAQDNKVVATIIVKLLETLRVDVHRVAQGDEALRALLREDFALALVDSNLPAMDGFEVTKRYRFAAIGRKRLPILGLIGAGNLAQIGACMDAGMDGCLLKPVDPAQLLEAVKSFLSVEAAADIVPTREEKETCAAPPLAPTDLAEAELPAEPPSVNLSVLKDLEQLGGRQFVEDVVSQFVSDANRIFPDLVLSFKNVDVEESRDLLHALRSCAANVGASAIFELCLAWREISADELVECGEACLARLRASFEEACSAMRDFEAAAVPESPPTRIKNVA